MIEFFVEQFDFEFEASDKTSAWLLYVVENEGYTLGNLTYIFTSDSYLLDMNLRYLKHDYFTDVITFDYVDAKLLSGDVFISIERVRENALKFAQLFDNELFRVIVHGLLHLCGYHDATSAEKKQMRAREDFYLEKLSQF